MAPRTHCDQPLRVLCVHEGQNHLFPPRTRARIDGVPVKTAQLARANWPRQTLRHSCNAIYFFSRHAKDMRFVVLGQTQ